LKHKNKLYPYKKLSVFYNSCLKTFGSNLVRIGKIENYLHGHHLKNYEVLKELKKLEQCDLHLSLI
jgi:hypothetical protein